MGYWQWHGSYLYDALLDKIVYKPNVYQSYHPDEKEQQEMNIQLRTHPKAFFVILSIIAIISLVIVLL